MGFRDRFGKGSIERSPVDRLADFYEELDPSRPSELHRTTARQELDLYADLRTKGWTIYAQPPGPDETGQVPLYEIGLVDSRDSDRYRRFGDERL